MVSAQHSALRLRARETKTKPPVNPRAYFGLSSFFDCLLVRLVFDLDSADFLGVARFGAVFFGAACLALADLGVTPAPDFLVAGAAG